MPLLNLFEFKSIKLSKPVIISITLFLFVSPKVKAQHSFYYKLDDENGLPSNEVYQVTQDPFGFIWIGCDAGLYKYDGINFTAFVNSKQNSRSISNLKVDSKGNIWCQNFTGQIFRTKNDSLILFKDLTNRCRQYPFFTLDLQDKIWIAVDSSILTYDYNGKLINELAGPVEKGKLKPNWTEIEYDGNKFIYAITGGGYGMKIDAKSDNFEYEELTLSDQLKFKNALFFLNNKLYIYTEQSPKRKYILSQLENTSCQFLQEQTPETPTGINYALTQTNPNEIWLGTSNGAVLLNNKFEPNLAYPKFFSEHKISNIFKDRENNYWFTSLQDGIFIVPDLNLQVYNKINSPLTDNNISTICVSDKNTLLIGDYLGELFSFNVKTNEIEPVQNRNKTNYRATRKIISFDKNHYIISRGLFSVLDQGKETIVSDLANIRDFVIHEKKIYYVSSDRLGWANIETFGTKVNPTILLKKGGKCVAIDTLKNIIYYGTTDGLIKFENGKLSEVKYNNQPIYALELFIENQTLWIGSSNAGMLIIEGSSNAKKSPFAHSIKGNSVRCFKKTQNHLLVSTEIGLTIVNLSTKKTAFLNKYDGLAFFEINKIEVIDNNAFLATIKGLIKIPLTTHGFNSKAPNIKLTDIKINGSKINYDKVLNLAFGKQNIEINFIGTSMRSRGSFNYKYRLKGFEEEWHITKSESPYSIYPLLPAGSFNFEVYAVNEDGVSSLKPATIKINVSSPYWQTWWFYSLIAIITALIVTLFFQQRIKYLKRQSIIKNKIILSQLTALKAQMNPHFMYNTLNSIQDLILQKDIKNTNYYLSKFSALMRKILDASGNNEILLSEEVEILELYLELEKLRFGTEFNYTIEVISSIDTSRIYIPSMIIQPYVENAMKHGLLHKKGPKQLTIEFMGNEKGIKCIISDNGVGIKRAMEIKQRSPIQHKSFASKATEKRLGLINSTRTTMIELKIGDLDPESEYPGTKVEITIPN